MDISNLNEEQYFYMQVTITYLVPLEGYASRDSHT